MLIDTIYKKFGIKAIEAKMTPAQLVVFETAADAELVASFLGVGQSIWEATDGFLLAINGYFLTTDWPRFQEARKRIVTEIKYRLV